MKKRNSKISDYIVVILFGIGFFGLFFIFTHAYDEFSPKITGWAITTFGVSINAIFTSPTPDDGSSTTDTFVTIKVNVTDAADLQNFTYNWGGTHYTVYDTNLVLMMNFDNVSAIGENSTYVIDASQYKNNGTAYGGVILNSSGNFLGGGVFDGLNAAIGLPTNSVFTSINDFSVSAWVKLDDNSGYNSIVSFGGSNGDEWLFDIYNGKINFYSTLLSPSSKTGNTTLSLQQWYYLTFVRNGSLYSFYVNGLDDGNGTWDETTITLTDGNRAIGRDTPTSGTEIFNGILDEVRIWNRSLSSSEVQQSYFYNFRKFDTDKWEFYVNQTNLTAGNSYTYLSYAEDTSTNNDNTGTRTISISSPAPAAVPEFSDYTVMLILIIAVGGFFLIRTKE